MFSNYFEHFSFASNVLIANDDEPQKYFLSTNGESPFSQDKINFRLGKLSSVYVSNKTK